MEPEAADFLDSQARWLAACMARESERADRVLNDPYASHLAGVAGARVFEEQTDDGRAFAAVLAVAVADDLVHRAVVDHRLHSVLHLGAGLDTRPDRLGLPNDLRWVELDLDAVFLYKIFRLAHVAPTCRVERVSVDVTDVAQRTGALRRAAHGVARGLLLTEHLLDRFTLGALKELSTRIRAGSSGGFWERPAQILLRRTTQSPRSAEHDGRSPTAGCWPTKRSGWRQAATRPSWSDPVRPATPNQ